MLRQKLFVLKSKLNHNVYVGSFYVARTVQGEAVNRGLKLFFHYIGLYILLRLMSGLKSTGCCGLDPWLTI